MIKQAYQVVLVEETTPPEGTTGTWHRYVIGEGRSQIEGQKQGTLKEVTEHAELTAEDLNERVNSRTTSNYRGNQQKKKT